MPDNNSPQGDRRNRPSRQRRGGQGRYQNRNPRGSRDDKRPQIPSKKEETNPVKKLINSVLGLFGVGKSSQASRGKSQPTVNVTYSGTKNRDRGAESSQGAKRERTPRPAPAPADPSSVTTERLYVGNLSYDAAESDLFELFQGVGNVRNAEVVVNNRTQRSKGFAFVTMASVEEARRAVVELHGKEFMGRPLQISGAKPSNRESDSEAQVENRSTADSQETVPTEQESAAI